MKTSTTTSKICIINNGKQYFRTPCTSVFNFSTFCNRSRPIKDVKMTFSSCVDNVTIVIAKKLRKFHFRVFCKTFAKDANFFQVTAVKLLIEHLSTNLSICSRSGPTQRHLMGEG